MRRAHNCPVQPVRTAMMHTAQNSLRGHLKGFDDFSQFHDNKVVMRWWISDCLDKGKKCGEDRYEMIAEPLPKTQGLP